MPEDTFELKTRSARVSRCVLCHYSTLSVIIFKGLIDTHDMPTLQMQKCSRGQKRVLVVNHWTSCYDMHWALSSLPDLGTLSYLQKHAG